MGRFTRMRDGEKLYPYSCYSVLRGCITAKVQGRAFSESRPLGGKIQPGFLSCQVDNSFAYAQFQHPWSRASNSSPFLNSNKRSIKLKKMGKNSGTFSAVSLSSIKPKSIKSDRERFLNSILFLLIKVLKKIKLKTLPIFDYSKNPDFILSLGGILQNYFESVFSHPCCVFTALAYWEDAVSFSFTFPDKQLSFDHGFCCCRVGQRRRCVCVFIFSQAGQQKKKTQMWKQWKNGQITAAGWRELAARIKIKSERFILSCD